MFLSELSNKEKNAFVDLSIHAAEVHGVIEHAEMSFLDEFCKEMELDILDADGFKEMDEIIAVFKDSKPRIKKIVLIELLGLVYSDMEYDEEERKFIEGFAKGIGVNPAAVDTYRAAVKKYAEALGMIMHLME